MEEQEVLHLLHRALLILVVAEAVDKMIALQVAQEIQQELVVDQEVVEELEQLIPVAVVAVADVAVELMVVMVGQE